ncbi:MAG: symmetrical bis(5'-nucleosyl)-tetraphosphatase [Steroidobacteraceae bacterium]
MSRYAIGDVQGCYSALRELVAALRFRADRDQLFFVGDLVNRGPQSLQVLRYVRSLDANACTVLGNHDLHLIARHYNPQLRARTGDTLDDVLEARDRAVLLDWLIAQPLAIRDRGSASLIVHAGLVPQWSIDDALKQASETSRALQKDPPEFLAAMYGNKPDRWREDLDQAERRRFTVNVLTRLRYCLADGTVNLKLKDAPARVERPWKPWFEHADRRSAGARIVFGHWSTLGLLRRPDLLALDTGCVWGGRLTAADLDDPEAPPVQVACEACQLPGAD